MKQENLWVLRFHCQGQECLYVCAVRLAVIASLSPSSSKVLLGRSATLSLRLSIPVLEVSMSLHPHNVSAHQGERLNCQNRDCRICRCRNACSLCVLALLKRTLTGHGLHSCIYTASCFCSAKCRLFAKSARRNLTSSSIGSEYFFIGKKTLAE